MKEIKKKVRRLFRKLVKPATWIQPKSVLILVIAVLIVETKGLVLKWLEIQIEEHSKTATITIEHVGITQLSAGQIAQHARSNFFPEFSLNLDDGLLEDYFVARFKLHNRSRIPVQTLYFDLELGTAQYSRLVDVQYRVLAPESKTLTFNNGLPNYKWTWPTQNTTTTLEWDPVPGASYNIYLSLQRDAGYGRVNPTQVSDRFAMSFAPSKKPVCWYARVSSYNLMGETISDEILTVANPAFMTESFEMYNRETNVYGRASNLSGFLRGKTQITIEPGLDSAAMIDIFALCKIIPGQTIAPSLTLRGSPGVGFRQVNLPIKFSAPDPKERDQTKNEFMPEIVYAVTFSNQVVLIWPAPKATNYGGIKIFRTFGRVLGDFSDIGEQVYEGYGITNDFKIVTRFPAQTHELPNAEIKYDQFIAAPPPPNIAPMPKIVRGLESPVGLSRTFATGGGFEKSLRKRNDKSPMKGR